MFYYFCLMIEGSGSGARSLTNGSGSGSRGPKNIWILQSVRYICENTLRAVWKMLLMFLFLFNVFASIWMFLRKMMWGRGLLKIHRYVFQCFLGAGNTVRTPELL
jgi:hypothetical protein